MSNQSTSVCVAGLWHLGCVTAASLASAGHHVVGYDDEVSVVSGLAAGRPPIAEPGLPELIHSGVSAGRLSFSNDPASAASASVVWITWDTPVDDDDVSDVDAVISRVVRLFPHVQPGALVVVSSQLPVGTVAALERRFAEARPGVDVSFVCIPENLRLGKAIEVFTKPDRFVVGVRRPADRARIAALLSSFTDRLEWMSVESAEMTKHAINAFLATSIAFMNEIASLCEQAGADAAEVSRGLKTESRIGPGAYLSPGGAFAGGTLARDIVSLNHLAATPGVIGAVRPSNERHRLWAGRRLAAELGSVRGRTIGIWGLTYKPGTNTLRRSSAVALCEALAAEGARVRAYDPSVKALPDTLARHVTLALDPLAAALNADALVVATAWPEFRDVPAASLVASGRAPIVLDAGRFLAASLGSEPGIRYVTVGRP